MNIRRSLLGLVLAAGLVSAGVPALSAARGGPCSPSTPQYCPPPTVKTGPAQHGTSTSATLTGTVNPNGSPTSCYFEYGRTTRYGSITPTQNVGSGTKPVKVSATVSGLAPNTTYHYQLVCHNLGGRGTGGDRSFKTKGAVAVRAGSTILVSGAGKFGVSVQCTGGHRCVGALSLTGPGGKPLARTVHYNIRSNTTVPFQMVLTPGARRQLARQGHLAGTLRAHDADGSADSHHVQLRPRHHPKHG